MGNHSLVHPREVFADVITDRAAFVILVHNHPSGTLELSPGRNPLLEKKGEKYRLRDFSERGGDEKLGLDGKPTIDMLHRISWLLENEAF